MPATGAIFVAEKLKQITQDAGVIGTAIYVAEKLTQVRQEAACVGVAINPFLVPLNQSGVGDVLAGDSDGDSEEGGPEPGGGQGGAPRADGGDQIGQRLRRKWRRTTFG